MPTHPSPGFHFQVEWGGARVGFAEVSGLGLSVEVIEYREGASPESSTVKLPGRVTYDEVVLRRGIIPGDGDFFAWINSVSMGGVERRDVSVSLLNENHEPVVVWKLRNAFPSRLEGPTLNASGNAVAIETLVLTHEGITIETE